MKESVGKSNEKSELLRAEGNQFYSQKKFFDALIKYNESLCHAEPESKNIGFAYANRSALYCEAKVYDKCLNNIALAKQNNYPQEKWDKLQSREEKCLEMIKRRNNESKAPDTVEFMNLSYPPNEILPFVANCLELKIDDQFGRHIVTNRPLRVGDVIAIEEPFCKVVKAKFIYQRCAGCFNHNYMDLIPCLKCRKAMFCSQECEKNSSFHQYECQLMELLKSSQFSSTMLMALRTLFYALTLFDGSIADLEKFITENTETCTMFDINSHADEKKKLLIVHSLISDGNVLINEPIFEKLFKSTRALRKLWSSHEDFILKFVDKQTQIATLNYHEIYTWPLKVGGLSDEEVDEFKGSLAYKRGVISTGNGSYPFCSLLNHHCAPNVSRMFNDDKIVLVVQRAIKRGDQIFDNYGYNFTNVSIEQRQTELLKQYRFKCCCEACENDWPVLPKLNISNKFCLDEAKKACRELSSGEINHEKAKQRYEEVSKILQDNRSNFPSLEICSMMESANAFLEMIMKPPIQFA